MANKIVDDPLELLKADNTFPTKDKLHVVYQKFEDYTPNNSSDICKIESSDHITIFNNEDDIVKLCIKVESILNNLNSICSKNNGLSDYNCCDYLIYWIYGKLIKENYASYKVHWLYNKMQVLLKSNQYGTNTKLKCNGNFKRVFGTENLKNKKYLHDFLEYFDSIKSILKSKEQVKQNYCDYIYYILQLYNNIKEGCYSRIPEPCPDEIELLQEKIKDYDLSDVKNKCPVFSQKFKLINWNAILDQLKKEQTMDVEREKPFKYRKLINYDIFHYLKKYQEAEKNARDTQTNLSNETEKCTEINIGVNSKHTELKTICEEFIPYFLMLSKTMINSIHYFDYLNYWLNKKLKETGIKATNFIGSMEKILSSKFSSNSIYKRFKHSVYDMNGNILDEMNILYNLYDDYNNFLEISEAGCTKSDTKCLSSYITEIDKCDNTKNKRFYKALTNILSRYNKKYKENCNDKTPEGLVSTCQVVKTYIKDINQKNCISSCQSFENTNFKASSKGEHEYENVLNKLTAQKMYKKLDDQKVDKSTCSNYCEDLFYMDDKHEDFNLLCVKMETNLKELSTVLADVTSHDDRCTYFIFWAYEKIINILNGNFSSHNDYYAINLLNQVLYTINKELSLGQKCPYYVDGALNVWKKEKYLHDYFKNFENIKNDFDKKPDNCNKYLGYLKHIRDLYMKDLKSCCAYYTNSDPVYLEMCPKYFKCDKKYFPNSLISKLNCGNEETNPNVDEVFKGLFVDLDVVTLSKMSNRAASNYLLNGSMQNLVSHLMGDKFNSAMFYSYSFLGISFLFFLLYKVTNRKSKSSKISHQMDIAMSDMQMQYEENPPLERKKPPQEKKKPPQERKKPPLERKKPPLERKPPPKKKSPRNERIRIAYASNN
ncbi:VIR protein [Plasmodium vivax]|uniref:VIR protein n=1 Tax=Plasmodium vivax TaxID=5855 RepID=A0A1G4GU03_PLAVI|nr:VIR protein [Plasmodium vivax]